MFAENPLFLFMDNMSPPTIAVKTPKETRKIVELSDTGCDARVPVSTVGRKSNRCRPARSPNIPSSEKWKFCEENKPYERFERNAMETDECCFVSISRKGGLGQSCWQKHSPAYEDFDDTGYRRRSDDSRPGVRVLPEACSNGNRRRRDDDGVEDPYRTEPSTVRYVDRELPRRSPNEHQRYPTSWSRRSENKNLGPKNGSKCTNLTYPTIDTNDPRTTLDRNNEIHRYLEDNYPLRNEIRNRNEHWQRCNFFNFNDHEKFFDETSQTFPKYNPKNERAASSSCTPSEVSRDWDDRSCAANRTRSRTCSPPSDRRKRTQTYSKSKPFYEEEQPENTQEIFPNNFALRVPSEKTGCFTEGSKRYVDRAVDKDSLSDLHYACTSTYPKSVIDDNEPDYISKCTVRTNFWDFIPLDDGNDKKRKIPSIEKSHAHQQGAPPSKDIDPRPKRRSVTNESINATPPLSAVRPELARSTQRSGAACRKGNLDQTEKVRRRPRASNPNVEENTDCEEQSECESKSRIKLATRLNFGWIGKNRSDLKRSSGLLAKSESSNEQNKKKIVVDSNYVMNICEKTVASLKRKLDKSEAEKTLPTTGAYLITEKKTRSEESSCSRLPVRIGNRLRSRNPISHRIHLKADVPQRQKAKQEDDSSRLNAIRSRTKPKVKSSLLANEVADLVETSEHGRSIGEGGGEREESSAEEKSKLSENHVVVKECSSELSKEMLQAKSKDSNDLAKAETSLDNDFMEEEIDRLSRPSSGLQEKCCFQLDDGESMVCSSNCDKDKRNFSPTGFRSRKHTATIRTQF